MLFWLVDGADRETAPLGSGRSRDIRTSIPSSSACGLLLFSGGNLAGQ